MFGVTLFFLLMTSVIGAVVFTVACDAWNIKNPIKTYMENKFGKDS